MNWDYLDVEPSLYNHIKWETFQVCSSNSSEHQMQVKRVRNR